MDLTWPKIVLLSFYAASALATIVSIGRPGKPLKSGTAAISVLLMGGLAALVIIA